MRSPYTGLHPKAFWRSGVVESHPLSVEELYIKKFTISPTDRVATAGSCFAQRVSTYMRKNGFAVMDVEPPPAALSEEAAKNFGYNIYSARYGNIYTVRQLLQLAQDAQSGTVDAKNVWEKDGRFYDALRPNVEPDGFGSVEEVLELRRDHLAKVNKLFTEMDVFIFTFGLCEAWADRRTGRVFPTAPGTIAGDYDPEIFEFKNFRFNEIHDDFLAFYDLVRERNPKLKILLTVSPVPMTATATDHHVLVANTYLKSMLRAVAGELSDAHPDIDYFPGYEMVATPFSKAFFYDSNLRTVSPAGLTAVMRIFFDQHGAATPLPERSRAEAREARRQEKAERRKTRPRQAESGTPRQTAEEEAVCEDILLETFAPQ
jgi:hypothetical protein